MTSVVLRNADETEAIGARVAEVLRPFTDSILLGLTGPLGAGKTTLVRGLLRELGVTGRVASPSYALIESYETDAGPVHHLDLYRLSDPGELDHLGLTDLLEQPALLLIEWPERVPALARRLDDLLELDYCDDAGGDGRRFRIGGGSPLSKALGRVAPNTATPP